MMAFCWHLNAPDLQTAKALTCWWAVNQLHLFLVKWRERNITYIVFNLRPAKDQIIFFFFIIKQLHIRELCEFNVSVCLPSTRRRGQAPTGAELPWHMFFFPVLTWFPCANPIPLIGELWQSPSSPVGSISAARWPHAGNRCICNRHHSQ